MSQDVRIVCRRRGPDGSDDAWTCQARDQVAAGPTIQVAALQVARPILGDGDINLSLLGVYPGGPEVWIARRAGQSEPAPPAPRRIAIRPEPEIVLTDPPEGFEPSSTDMLRCAYALRDARHRPAAIAAAYRLLIGAAGALARAKAEAQDARSQEEAERDAAKRSWNALTAEIASLRAELDRASAELRDLRSIAILD